MQLVSSRTDLLMTTAFLILCPLSQLNILHKEGEFYACRSKFNDFQRIKIEMYDEGNLCEIKRSRGVGWGRIMENWGRREGRISDAPRGKWWSYYIITFDSLIKFPFQVMIYVILQASSCLFNRKIGFRLYDIFPIVFEEVQGKSFNECRTVWR